MHQLACGVDETIRIDRYTVRILEVADGEVRFGISIRGDREQVHQIRLPQAGERQPADTRGQLTTR
jgi:hypothetical protein